MLVDLLQGFYACLVVNAVDRLLVLYGFCMFMILAANQFPLGNNKDTLMIKHLHKQDAPDLLLVCNWWQFLGSEVSK